MNNEKSVVDKSNLIILVVNNVGAIDSISNDAKAFEAYKNIHGRYKNMNVCIIFGDYPNTSISYASPELMRNLRDARHFLYFNDIDSMKILDLPLLVMRQFKKPIEIGD